MKSAYIAMLLLAACAAPASSAASIAAAEDWAINEHMRNTVLWTTAEGGDYSTIHRQLGETGLDEYGDKCAAIQRPGECKEDADCLWIKSDKTCKTLADAECGEIDKKRICKTLDDKCYWDKKAGSRNGECKEIGGELKCSEITKVGKCKRTEGCIWDGDRNDGVCKDEDDVDTDECSDFDKKKDCKNADGCAWVKGKCKVEEPALECSEYDKKKDCKDVDGCAWVKGKCKDDDGGDQAECADYDKKECKKAKKCDWVGKGDEATCESQK